MRARLRLIATLIGIVGTAAVAIWFLFHLTGDPPRQPHEPITLAPPPPRVESSVSATSTTLPTPASVATGTASTVAIASASTVASVATLEMLDLASATATVDTQLRLLRAGKDGEFRATFLPAMTVTNEQIAACKKRIDQVPVRPDWEMAEDSMVDGHPVKRVSMFGKSMTGFHELAGKWLADAVWCVPTGLP